ncbi:MAG: GNAT family N-acetyltransferase, partial [Candidatus Promineifilaceae bacterium]
MFSLKTERLLLRDFQPDDFDAFFATTNDPEYQQFYAEEEMTRPFWQQIFTHILEGTAELPRDSYQLAICLPDGTLIGTCGVRLEDAANRQASFGCAIARPFWGHGYATEASHA